MLWRPPRRSWCMHRILCTACNRNSTRSFERGHDGNILEEAYRGRYARQRLLNFWPESSCGYHAIKRFVCIIQVLALFGQTAWGIHAGLLCVNAATVLIIYFLARRLLDDGLGAVVAAATFGILSIDRWIMGVFAHATHFVVLAAMVLFHALESKRTIAFIGAGLKLGLSVLMKENGIFFLAFGLGAALWIEIERNPKNLWTGARTVGLLAVSSVIPFIFVTVVLFSQGV